MKIATLNIDWFKKSKNLQKTIYNEIKNQDLDFLVVNENIESFSFDDKYFVYHSKSIQTAQICPTTDSADLKSVPTKTRKIGAVLIIKVKEFHKHCAADSLVHLILHNAMTKNVRC